MRPPYIRQIKAFGNNVVCREVNNFPFAGEVVSVGPDVRAGRFSVEEKKNGEALKPYEYPPERLRGNARETMNECDILILDDLGHEKPGFAREAVTEAIMTRYDECLPTIFTTNLNWPPLEGEGSKEANQVAVTYGEPADSRLRESCAEWRCPERDYRIRKANT